MKRYIYLASLFDGETAKKVFNREKKPMQAANKYHTLMCRGLAENGAQVQCFSVLPVNRTNCGKLVAGGGKVQDGDYAIHYPLVFNLPVVKHLALFLQAFWKLLTAPKGTVLLYDVLVITASYGACLGAKLRRFPKVGIVTDLPEFMQVAGSGWMLRVNEKVVRMADMYVLLTEQMNEKINEARKPYIVLEGHVDSQMDNRHHVPFAQLKDKCVVYAGSLHAQYGIKMLCDAFLQCCKPGEILHVYGDGDYAEEVKKLSESYDSICYHGNVPNTQVVEAELEAALLVNPRPSSEEFTKYSFPSKTMEYMVSGTPVLMTRLPGMPKEYCEYVYLLRDETVDAMAQKLREILDKPMEELERFGAEAREFVLKEKTNVQQAEKLAAFIEKTR